MIPLIGLSSASVVLLILLGLPSALLIFKKLPIQFQRGTFLIASALLFGFGAIAISSAWSFGLFGIENFGFILLALFIVPTILLIVGTFKGKRPSVKILWDKFDFGMILLFPLAALMNRVHIDQSSGLGFRSGDGPDMAQNLMSFVGLDSRGSTWLSMKTVFEKDIGAESLYDGLENIYTSYSFQAQAVYDYLLYGTRWGLSIPASLANDFFGNQNTILYPALISTIGILALGIVTYGFLSILINNLPLALCVSTTITSSGTFMYQTFNGGLAQAWALPGVGAMGILLLMAFTKVNARNGMSRRLFLLLVSAAWLTIAVPYFDAALVLALLIFLVGLAQLSFSKFKDSEILIVFSSAGLLAALFALPFSLVAGYTLPIRLRLASGTGIDAPNWPLPSELFGFGNIWTDERSSFAFGISVTISIFIIGYFIRGLISKRVDEKALGQIGIAILIIIALSALASSISVASNNYIYMKVGAYLAPIAITLLYLLLSGKSIYNTSEIFRSTETISKDSKNKKNLFLVVPIVPLALTLAAVFSSQSTASGLVSKGVYFPKDFGQISTDPEAQKALTDYNYFLFYTPSSNTLGAFADVVWISKAPNDMNLKARKSREIRVLCYSFNQECTPPGTRISVPSLEKYGLLSFTTSISIDQYMALGIQERYDEAFKQTGQDPVVIPERFLGGNPLLKP
jgi:hypothetical protein